MNFSNILSQIERLDPEVYERTSMRRDVIKTWARRVSLTALPFALGSLFNKAYGKTGAATIAEVLQFALLLEYLESEFYLKAIQATEVDPPKTQLIPNRNGLELPAIKKIYYHEVAHVKFLQSVLTGMNETPISAPTFDFTGGMGTGTGPFTSVFADYGVFLAVAQMLEDTGVRAYKGQLATLKPNNDVLTAAVRIHSVEARHAAHIRMMRKQYPHPLSDNLDIMPWITLDQSSINSGDYQAAYAGDNNTEQVAIEVEAINGQPVTEQAAAAAFDEPLNIEQVTEIVSKFLAP
jgi:hypothetical protein